MGRGLRDGSLVVVMGYCMYMLPTHELSIGTKFASSWTAAKDKFPVPHELMSKLPVTTFCPGTRTVQSRMVQLGVTSESVAANTTIDGWPPVAWKPEAWNWRMFSAFETVAGAPRVMLKPSAELLANSPVGTAKWLGN